jgi:dephospho-CoA kinase
MDATIKLIGVGGTNGSGKDTVMQLLAEQYGFLSASATEMFLVELKKRGLPADRDQKSRLSAEWRREHGMGVIVDKAVEMFNAEPGKYKGIVVGSLRHPGEADRIHELGGTMVWVDADPKIRYDRIQKNLHERTSSHVEEGKSFEEFKAEEEREMSHSGDNATLNMAGVKARADIFLENNGSPEEFKQEAIKRLV